MLRKKPVIAHDPAKGAGPWGRFAPESSLTAAIITEICPNATISHQQLFIHSKNEVPIEVQLDESGAVVSAVTTTPQKRRALPRTPAVTAVHSDGTISSLIAFTPEKKPKISTPIKNRNDNLNKQINKLHNIARPETFTVNFSPDSKASSQKRKRNKEKTHDLANSFIEKPLFQFNNPAPDGHKRAYAAEVTHTIGIREADGQMNTEIQKNKPITTHQANTEDLISSKVTTMAKKACAQVTLTATAYQATLGKTAFRTFLTRQTTTETAQFTTQTRTTAVTPRNTSLLQTKEFMRQQLSKKR